MAILKVPAQNLVTNDPDQIKKLAADIGIGYERWNTDYDLSARVKAETILNTYAQEIEELKKSGGYVTADVIDINPDTPNLDAMLNKFNKEHWHSEDEVRFTIEGHGIFHINPKNGPVVAIKVEKGDLIRVPAGMLHWFDICADRRIRVIRLFQDPNGWSPYYTDSNIEKKYMPVCFGFDFIPSQFQQL